MTDMSELKLYFLPKFLFKVNHSFKIILNDSFSYYMLNNLCAFIRKFRMIMFIYK